MKYAWNLSEGNGLVWNRFDKVEGYTNPLWTLVMALINSFAGNRTSVLIVQLLGIPILLGIIYYTAKLVQATNFSPNKYLQILIGIVTVATWYPLSYWTLMGMETGLLTLLILLSFYYSVLFIQKEKVKHLYLTNLFLVLAYFTRPDSIYLAILIFTGIFYFKKEFRILISKMIAVYILYISAHILFRIFYYGEAVPNTVILKVFGMPFLARIQNGWAYTKLYMSENFILIFLTLFGMLRNPNNVKTFLGLPVLATIAYQVYVGGDPWYYWRFFLTVFPLIVVISTAEIINIFESLKDSLNFGLLRYPVSLLIFCTIVLGVNFIVSNERFLRQMVFKVPIFSTEYNEINTKYALALKEISDEEATVGVIWAGAVPYFSERDGIDFLGKSDRYISRVKPNLNWSTAEWGMKTYPGHNKYDLKYSILELRPDFIERPDWFDQYVGTDPSYNYRVHVYKGVSFYVRSDSSHTRNLN